jgi:catechol 2,3-dioxygenase-like lactoylglutathione lyase family enzyme
MRATRIMANLRVADVEATKSFYTDYLGLSTEEFNMGWSPGRLGGWATSSETTSSV